jgi:hypothetical protein
MWQMELQFFASFPELLDDISATEPTLSEFTAGPCSSEIPLHDRDSSALYNTSFDGVNVLDMKNFLNVYDHDVSLSVQRLDMFNTLYNAP